MVLRAVVATMVLLQADLMVLVSVHYCIAFLEVYLGTLERQKMSLIG